MVGESLTTRLARERLASIKKFMPVRDRLCEKLQQRQEEQTDLSVSSEQLFAPITSATKDVKTLTEAAIYGDIPEQERAKKAPLLDTLEKIAAETGQTRAGIQQLSGDIKSQREYERLGDIDESAPAPGPSHPQVYRPGEIEEQEEEQRSAAAGKDYSPKNIFTVATLNKIERPDTDYELANFARDNFPKGKRENLLNDEFESFIKTRDTWASKIYLAKHGGDRISASQHPGYNNFLAAVKGGPQPPRYMKDPIPEEIDIAGSKKTSGKGYVRRSGIDFTNDL